MLKKKKYMKEFERPPVLNQENNPLPSVREDMRRLKFAIKDVHDRRSRGEIETRDEFRYEIGMAIYGFIHSLGDELPEDFIKDFKLSDRYRDFGRSRRHVFYPRVEVFHPKIERCLLEKRKATMEGGDNDEK